MNAIVVTLNLAGRGQKKAPVGLARLGCFMSAHREADAILIENPLDQYSWKL